MARGTIISIGARAADILRSASLLQVTATYDRCFYLRTGPHVVCVGDASIGAGPLNAVIQDYRQHAFERSPDETVWTAGATLNFSDGTAFDWSDAARWTTPDWPEPADGSSLPAGTLEMLYDRSPADGLFRLAAQQELRPSRLDADLPVLSPPPPLRGRTAVPRFLCFTKIDLGSARLGGALPPGTPSSYPPPRPSPARGEGGKGGGAVIYKSTSLRIGIDTEFVTTTPLHTRARPALEELEAGLIAAPPWRDPHLKAAVSALIGLGPGLTPSGDDVLAGALLGLHARGSTALAAQLGAHVATACIDGTSPLSAALLRCAIDGETSADLHHIFSAALTATNWPSALDTLSRIGHTSGWDHLAGFMLALTVGRKIT